MNPFNTNAIVYDNTPWRPGRETDGEKTEEDERRLKNLATRIMSNGVEVLVKDKSSDGKLEQRKVKLMHIDTMPSHNTSSQPKQLLSSAVATVFNHQQISALFPLHQLMQHNYIIKTCMTTFTYLTTVVQNKRSAISTFETIVSVVTTESLTNLHASDLLSDLKPTKTKYMDVKTIQPSTPTNIYASGYPKIDKRIDNPEDIEDNNFDLIQPSEVSHASCTTSCSCSHTKTEGLKTKYTNLKYSSEPGSYGMKTSQYGATKLDLRPTIKDTLDKKTQYGPYEYESSSHLAPTDKVVEKYTEVINDYSEEKDTNSVEQSELLTNEQAPEAQKINKPTIKNPEKPKPEKPTKTNKNKFVVADLLKLGSLGIKGLSQLAPVFEKMTGGFIKRQDTTNRTTTTIKPAVKLTPYVVNKRVDSELESKQSNFPIYIPVDELETSESQIVFTNATLHQNLAWAAEHKQPKAHIVPPKFIHESPLVNGGIPISPGEIITANSDVIVGKPAVGGPLTLAASGIKLHNPVNPPPIDSFVSANEHYVFQERPSNDQLLDTHVDDSFDLRPPELPKPKQNRPNNTNRPTFGQNVGHNRMPYRGPPPMHSTNDYSTKIEPAKPTNSVLGNHGRPAFLDYIPSFQPNNNVANQHHVDFTPAKNSNEDEVIDNSPSSSEVVNTQIRTDGHYTITGDSDASKPFLVDIQPSRVANVLIPHGSSTALVFAGSSEPHKTGDYIDDPLPYPEPGYFGSFSIDAPQMTNVHNVAPNNNNKQFLKPNTQTTAEPYKPNVQFKEQSNRNDLKQKWKDNKRPVDYNKIPPPTSNQETHVQVGPQITEYNPDIYNPSNGNLEALNQVRINGRPKDGKDIIDKEYENYLAVPPPPPKRHFSQENNFDKNKPYHQRPIVHTKPIQDMKVFLNVQHPVPNAPNHEQKPPKVTSEIYFASQMPGNKATPTYTIHIPPPSPTYGSNFNKVSNNQAPIIKGPHHGPIHNSFTIIPSPNIANKSISTHSLNDKENTYTVTLNTATNVASHVGDEQVIGSSVPVAIDTSNINQNTDIPIGTNFAIRVDDDIPNVETFNLKGNRNPPIIYDQHGRVPLDVAVGDNRWNKSTGIVESTIIGTNYYDQDFGEKTVQSSIKNNNIINNNNNNNNVHPAMVTSLNSHANFPMLNDYTTPSSNNEDTKPVTEYNEFKPSDIKRPGKLIPNIPTNSHGWYSSVLSENKINNIKVESTTRKIIPLIHDYNKDSIPAFGQKITSVGKPPTEFWTQNKQTLVNFNVGKPFTKPQATEKPFSSIPPLTTNTYNGHNYILSNFGTIPQPAYDIPIRDNSYEITTVKIKQSTEKSKPVYENSEEVYDGEDVDESIAESDGEVSLESMKIPVVSTSSEKESNLKSSTELSLLQDEVVEASNKKPVENKNKLEEFNPGTQTEKPFGTYNKSNTIQSNTIKPIEDNNNPYTKPRPFTMNTPMILDHQLQQPHWQINQLLENVTNVSYEENIDLNIGEEIQAPSSVKPSVTQKPKPAYTDLESKYKKPQRPGYSVHRNNTKVVNDSNIITSTVHIHDKKPLIVEKTTAKSDLPSFTIKVDSESDKSASDIIDLSPPPPTLDYNFKPSTNDEMIMGMSPPPPRTPPAIKVPPRVPMTPRPIPVRTPPPYRTKPPRTLPPRLSATQRPIRKPITRDEISTYRPAFDLNNIRRPVFNLDQPSSQLLPPPRDLPARATNDIPSPTMSAPSATNLVFPTPISSGWLTSTGIDFSSSFNFAPTSIQFPQETKPSEIPDIGSVSSAENIDSYENEYSAEKTEVGSSEKPVIENNTSSSKEMSTETDDRIKSSTEANVSDSFADESSQEDTTTDRIKVVPLGIKNRTRKPYPSRNDDKKTSTSKYKLPTKVSNIIKPTRTFSRPGVLYPTRQTSIRNIVRPLPSRSSTIRAPSIIESSESSYDEEFIRPTQILTDSSTPTVIDITNLIPSATVTPNLDEISSLIQTHHAGNEVKISDEFIPTKTEFKTTVITLTKTLSEPPSTISSIGYVNLTHTLTVTHTKTSLVSQSDGAVTQTLVLTNTQTSTVVDVVTEVHTEVQPTTIIETVTKHIPVPQVEPTPVRETMPKTKVPLDDISMSSEENDLSRIKDNDLIIKDETTENVQKIDTESDNDTFFVVMNKSQNGGNSPPVHTDIETGDYDGVTRNEQVNSNGVAQVLFGEILLAGTPYLETSVVNPTGVTYGKECQPDCKASRNERCQRIDGIMKCVCRPGFARMFPDRPCKPTYTYSVKLALGTQGNEKLKFQDSLADNSSKPYHTLALATHEGINRMIMQSDLRDVYHGVHITGFHPVDVTSPGGELYQGVMNDFYVQLSDNAHESRLKEVIEKYLRTNNYSLGGTEVHAAAGLVDQMDVSDFDECLSGQFHDCSEHAQCFNLRGTYTCSCLEGYADLSVNTLYPGRICSAEPVGCERCNYHGACYSRDDKRVLCECFQWYAGSSCQVNLKVVLISLVVLGALLTIVLVACAVVACSKKRPQRPQRSIVACIQGMPSLHQGAMPSKQRADRRALISERGDSGDTSSIQNASLPYMPTKQRGSVSGRKVVMSAPPAHEAPPPPPAPALMIPRARLHAHHGDSRENIARKRSLELSSEAKLISYLESGATTSNDEMRRKHSLESSYSANPERHNKQGALVSAGFKVSTTIRPDETMMKDDDDLSSVHKGDLEAELARLDALRKSYSQEDLSEWTDAERRLGELTLSEARSVGGTLPASTGRAASSTRLTHQEANTMAERDLGSTFLLPHVHLYKPDLTSDVSEFDSL